MLKTVKFLALCFILCAGLSLILATATPSLAQTTDTTQTPQKIPKNQNAWRPLISKSQSGTIKLPTLKNDSPLMPLLPPEFLKDTPSNIVTTEVADQLYVRCKSQLPPRFTPDAHEYYCSCATAATVGTMKMSEIQDLQSTTKWVLGNKNFEKYINDVVHPCMDFPVEDMEYLSCVLNRNNDWRIKRIPEYCKCVSYNTRKHVERYGNTEILITWGTPNTNYASPLDALWNNETYNDYKRKYREECIGNYMESDPYNR